MEKRTINGKTITEVITELGKDFPDTAIKVREYDNVVYIPERELRNRLDAVIGIEHYNEEYTEPVYTQVKGTYGISTVGRLEILDDDFKPVMVKTCVGASSITFPKISKTDEQGKDIKVEAETTNSFANDSMAACQDAFKRICKKLGMGVRQLEEAKKGKMYELVVAADRSYGNKGTYVDCGSITLAIFSNKAECAKKVFPNGFKKGDRLFVYGKENEYNGKPQLIFESFAERQVKASSEQPKQADVQKPQQKTPQSKTAPTSKEMVSGITVELNLSGEIVQKQNQYMIGCVNTATGEIGRLFFSEENQRKLEANGFWVTMKNEALKDAGVTIRIVANQKGTDFLYVSAAKK